MFFQNTMFSNFTTGFYGFSTGYDGFSTGSLGFRQLDVYFVKKKTKKSMLHHEKRLMGHWFLRVPLLGGMDVAPN